MHVRERATVLLRDYDRETEKATYLTEWTHAAELETDDWGVTLSWGGDQERTFVPWANVLRIDWTECTCMQCERVAEKLEAGG